MSLSVQLVTCTSTTWTLSQRLVGIQADCDDAQRCLVQWLPDSGAEVDAIGQKDLDKIDPHLKLTLSPNNLMQPMGVGSTY